ERGGVGLELFGRLAPGASVERAQAELQLIAARLAERYPETNTGRGIVVAPDIGFAPPAPHDVRTYTGVRLGVGALVLLVACAHVASRRLARGSVGAREVALRAWPGASRARLVRRLLAEGILLARAGGLVGLLLGVVWLRLVL